MGACCTLLQASSRSGKYSSGDGGRGGAGTDSVADARREMHEETLASLRKSRTTLAETTAIGEATAEELARQGDTLRRIKGKVEDMNDDLDRANWLLTGMESVKGWMVNSWFSKAPGRRSETAKGAADDKKKGKGGGDAAAVPPAPLPAPSSKGGASGAGSSGVAATTGTSARTSLFGGRGAGSTPAATGSGSGSGSKAVGAPPSEVDDLLDSMADELKRLKGLSLATGAELDKHSVLLTDIHSEVDRANTGLHRATARSSKLSKS